MNKADRDKRRLEQSPDRQRRQTLQLIAAVTALGSGLGVHLPTALAAGVARTPPPPGMLPEQQKPQAGPGQGKPKAPRPGASQAKPIPAMPGASQAKPIPAMPGATQAKPIPAQPGASQFKIRPETEEALPDQELNAPVPR